MARPPRSLFLQLPSQARSIWDTMPDVRGALDMLELGVFRHGALLADQMLRDDRIRGVLGTRLDALTSAPVEIKPGSKLARAARIARQLGGYEAAEGYEEPGGWHDMFSPAAVSRLVYWGLMVGIGVAQIVWTTSEKKWTPRLVPWHPQFIRWDWSTQSYKLQTMNAGEIELPRVDEQVTADGQWVVWCPYGYREGWMWSMVRWLADKYIMRQWDQRDWARYNEVHGQPLTIAFVPQNALKEEKDGYTEDLANAHGERVLQIPIGEGGREAGWGAEMLEATARTFDSFAQFKTALDADIGTGVLGLAPNMNVGGDAAGENRLVRLDKGLADAQVVHALRAQVLVPWARFNYGDETLAPRPKYCVEPAADELAEANTLKAAADAALQLSVASPKTDVDAILERFGVPLRSDEDMAAEASAGVSNALDLTPSSQGAIVTVNEARRSIGLGPLTLDSGAADPDGDLTLADYQAKHAVAIASAAAAGAGNSGAPTDEPAPADGGAQQQDAGDEPPADDAAALGARTDGAPRRVVFAGFKVAIEHPAGSYRVFEDEAGQEVGRTLMVHDYGYFEGVVGKDKEELDVYLGPTESAPDVHVVHQLRAPKYSVHDEDKVMLGFASGDTAKRAYLAHRHDGSQAFGTMSTIPVERFRAQLQRRTGTGKIHAGARTFTGREVVITLARAGLTVDDVADLGVTYSSAALAGRQPKRRLYGDQVADRALPLGARALASDVAGIQEDIDAATSLEDLRSRILRRFRGKMDPAKLREVMRRARLMADLGGRMAALKQIR